MRAFVLGATFAGLVALAAPAAAGQCVAAADRAQDLRAAGQLRAARSELLVCAAPSCNAVVRADCVRWLKEVDADSSSIVVRIADPRAATVSVDDAPASADAPVVVDPGSHVVRARFANGETLEETVSVAPGEKGRTVELRVTPPPTPEPRTPAPTAATTATPGADVAPSTTRFGALPIVLASVGGVSLAAFAYFEVSGSSGYSDLAHGCAKTHSCTSGEIDPVRAQFVAAQGALVVGVVTIAAAVVLHFVDKPSPATTAIRAATTGVRF